MECPGCGCSNRWLGWDGGVCGDCHKAKLALGWRPEPIVLDGYLGEAGMDSDERLDDWRVEYAQAREAAQAGL